MPALWMTHMRGAEMIDPSATDLVTLAGVFVGGIIAAYIGYKQKPTPPSGQAAVMAGVGYELGNREQMAMLTHEVKRIADALTDKNAETITDRLDELTQRLDEKQERPVRRRRP